MARRASGGTPQWLSRLIGRKPVVALLLLLAVLVGGYFVTRAVGSGDSGATSTVASASAPVTSTSPSNSATGSGDCEDLGGVVEPGDCVDPESGLPVVAATELPSEARHTLDLIETDGPFPHDEDGTTFQNREGILPAQNAGYYKEYTVQTPGSDDRGARRIVAGAGKELYYTDDHYQSFVRIGLLG